MTRTSVDDKARAKKADTNEKRKKKLLDKLNHKNIGDGTDDKVEIDALSKDVKTANKEDRPVTVSDIKQGLAKRRVQQDKHVREQNLPVKQPPKNVARPKTAPSKGIGKKQES